MATVRHLGLLPFCFSFSAANGGYGSDALGNYAPYPIGLNLETLLRWYWLVKKWTFSATLTGTDFRGEPVSTSFQDTFFNWNMYSPELTTEKQLVCGRNVEYIVYNNQDVASFVMFLDGVQKVDQLYYPSLSFSYSNIAGEIGTYGNITGGTITMDGIAIPSYFLPSYIPSSFDSPSSGSITITPSEYWPYDPEDGGGPIYDSATGTRIRSDV